MRILQINAVGQYGSTGRNCAEFAQYVNQQTEHRCYTAFSEGESNEYAFQIGTPFEKKIHALLSRISGKQAHFSRRGTVELLRRISEIKPDVVHLHNLHSNYIYLPMLLRYLAENDIPTVLTLHDCWFYTGKCCYYTADGCNKWQTGCGHCSRIKKDNPSWFIDATARLWTEKKELFAAIPRLAVVGVSNWITEEAKKSFLSCAQEIRRIYNWIDLDVFCPREDAGGIRARFGAGKKIVLGVASGWSERKGLSSFVNLAEMLGEEYCVVLVGKLDFDIKLPRNVRHIPETESTDELAQYYSMANVFVTLSLEETFGKVSAEALACGTPVVCYDSTANKELVGDNCGAVLVPGDLKGVEQAVRSICHEGKARYIEHCRCFTAENFEKEKQINKHLDLYLSLQN